MPTWTIDESGRWPLGRFPRLAARADVVHAVTTREGPDFGTDGSPEAAADARDSLAGALGLAATAWARQVHGGTVFRVTGAGLAGEADALITATAGLLLIGRSADCPLILVSGTCADGTPAVGFAHASWRATVAGITETMIVRLQQDLGVRPATVVAAIAPSAGPCCYEVGPEVKMQAVETLGAAATRFFVPGRERDHFDLWAANTAQLMAAGVPPDRIVRANVCTICRGERFWSWRVEREAAGRFAAAIGIRSV